MNKRILIPLFLIPLFFTLCMEAKSANPLLVTTNTNYGVPPFDQITESDYMPAFTKGMEMQNSEIDDIINNKKSPDFINTIVALENSGKVLRNAQTIFYNLNSANTSEGLQQIAKDVAPIFSKHSDNISLNTKLFKRVKAVYDMRNVLKLKPEDARLLDKIYKDFVRSGANLNSGDKDRLRKINSELSLLSVQFGQNLLAETNNFKLLIDNKDDLAGLPQGIIDIAAENATQAGNSGKWMFSLQNPSVMAFLQYADNRTLREKIWKAYSNRGNNNNAYDTKNIISKIIELRAQRAQLLGFKTYADYALDETMAKTPDKVYELLNKLWTPALLVAKKEAADMQKIIDSEKLTFKLSAWDWRYYAEKVRKARYDLDEEALKPYFKLENVRDGVFNVAHQLYGINITAINYVPKYHNDVQSYLVKNDKNEVLAILYMDFFPRTSKRGGAWMTNYRDEKIENGKRVIPVISVVCNFTPPTASSPSLLTFDEVTTLFHEFGHALHGMLSQCTYESLSGTAVARDFVELPSQIMENWAAEPQVIKQYARHYKTNEVMPDVLIEKLTKSSLFNQGFATVEYLAASLLDMDYHTQTGKLDTDIETFEKQEMKKLGLIDEIIPRYRTTYFNHIWGGGYSAGYYSYIWAEVLDADAFAMFKKNGIFDTKTANAFRSQILEKGGTEDPMLLYMNFRGANPSIEPLIERRGLNLNK